MIRKAQKDKMAEAPAIRIAAAKKNDLVGCAACHAIVERNATYKCPICGVYGCAECGFKPDVKVCPKCGATIRKD